MRIAISAESTIDLPDNLLEKFNIQTIPFTITLGNKTAKDGKITSIEIINFVKENNILPKTSAINAAEYEEYFSKLKENYDAVIHFSLSSKMSSAYSNAVLASHEVENVYVIDTKSLSTGIALLAIYASKHVNLGLGPEEIVNKVTKRIPTNQTSFVLSKLKFLYMGGRCSSLKFLATKLLKIRPQIVVEEGQMGPKHKYMGKFDKCAITYVNDVLKTYTTPDLEQVFITYTTADKEIVEEIRNILKEKGFKNIYETRAGGTITSHCGEKCLGILYLNDGDENGVYN